MWGKHYDGVQYKIVINIFFSYNKVHVSSSRCRELRQLAEVAEPNPAPACQQTGGWFLFQL